ncbi:MAG: preprotein translocase subunit SecA [Myxococcota bacterium]|jgi:preprotein translocase subunit SecA|nr:preprotein translocase subunit SecA [Myxococcota bacterium]
MQRVLSKVFGTANDREIKRIMPLVVEVASLEPRFEAMSDEELAAMTPAFRARLEEGETLDDLLPEAFAVVREAAKRTLGQRHYDVQVIGGIMLHRGKISEMKTGEGKTLVATLASYLNGLSGQGVHVVTVNDYLAARDAEWMGEVHRFLGLTVGKIVHGLSDEERRESYDCDITYCTNNELGFDYLRDNMKVRADRRVQRELNYAIIDEVDSILVDEARTPLIISGPSEENTQVYSVVNRVIPSLKEGTKGEPSKGIAEAGDYWLDRKSHSATLTEDGIHKVEKMLNVENLYDPQMLPVNHAISQALVAHTLKRRDVDYMVAVGDSGKKEVIIIDEHTGRAMPGRRWSDGLHQAVEAKEGIQVRSENQTLATVTFQNFFRMYSKISGMTGTADTEAPEFAKIYNLDVSIIPTHRPLSRDDLSDVVFKTREEKFDAVADEIEERQKHGQPVLVGTISIETSEDLSKVLKKRKVKHNVLNAKHHEREADIVAQAGRKEAVTISTNMAGRGTDIVLGGNPEFLALQKCGGDKDHPDFPEMQLQFERECEAEQKEVLEAGGLHILGTERHESRRIDNQLRGRAGRQGDPGSSQFFLSLEDNLLQIFEADRVSQWWDRVGVEKGEAIENRMLTRVIEGAQKKVEARNFDMRKHLLDYDDVMNKQRQAFYARRLNVLLADSLQAEIDEIIEGIVVNILHELWPAKGSPEDAQVDEIIVAVEKQFGLTLVAGEPPFVNASGQTEDDKEAFGRTLLEQLHTILGEKKQRCEELVEEFKDLGYPKFEVFERDIMLQVLDTQWKDHLHTMDGLREGISLRGYAQKDPKVEYQREGFALFEETEQRMDDQAAEVLFRFALPMPKVQTVRNAQQPKDSDAATPGQARGPQRNKDGGGTPGKVGRNDPCPCGSGKKYKKCCAA